MYGLTEKNCQNLTQSWQAKGTCRCDGYWGGKYVGGKYREQQKY